MPPSSSGDPLTDQLLRVAVDPGLRTAIYDRLGEYCHQCRNRLNSLKLSLYLLTRRSPGLNDGPWLTVDRHYRDLERRVDQIQSLFRPIPLSRVKLGLDVLIEDRRASWTQIMAQAGKTLEIIGPTDRVLLNFDVDRLGRGLDALVAWRAGDSRSGNAARVRWWNDLGVICWIWEEFGAPPPHHLVDEPRNVDDDSVWALPMLARVIEAHQGEFRIATDDGFRLELRWPTTFSPQN